MRSLFNKKSGVLFTASLLLAGSVAACGGKTQLEKAKAYLETITPETKVTAPKIRGVHARAEYTENLVQAALLDRDLQDEALRVLFAMEDDTSPEVLREVAVGIGRLSAPGIISIEDQLAALCPKRSGSGAGLGCLL